MVVEVGYQGRLRAPFYWMRIYVCTQAHYSGTLKGTLIYRAKLCALTGGVSPPGPPILLFSPHCGAKSYAKAPLFAPHATPLGG